MQRCPGHLRAITSRQSRMRAVSASLRLNLREHRGRPARHNSHPRSPEGDRCARTGDASMITKRDLKVAPGRPLCSRRRPVFMRAAARPHAALLQRGGAPLAVCPPSWCDGEVVARDWWRTTACRHGAARPRACGRSAEWTAWAGEPAPMRRRRGGVFEVHCCVAGNACNKGKRPSCRPPGPCSSKQRKFWREATEPSRQALGRAAP